IAGRPIPADSLNRALVRAESIAARPRRRRLVLVVTGVAAVAATFIWSLRPATGWARVADSIRSQPWVHGTAKRPDGSKQEFWFSAGRGLSANRSANEVLYDDDGLGIRHIYETREKVLYRVSQPSEFAKQEFDAFRDVFEQFHNKDDQLRSPLAGADVVRHERRRLSVDGRTWAEFDLTLRHLPSNELAHVIFRVPPETLLPQSMRLTSAGQDLNFALEYPRAGPADIYALGVPRDAKLVDRVPPNDLAAVLRGMREGRKRFGPYRAVVVETVGNDPPWDAFEVHQVWRKGNRWRVEDGYRKGVPPPAEPPGPGTRAIDWWDRRLTHYNVLLASVGTGKAAYEMRVEGKKKTQTWTEVGRVRPNDDGVMSVGRVCHQLPDLVTYGWVPVPGPQFIVALDRAPKDGPPGAYLVTARVPEAARRQGEVGCIRCWIDPLHSYAALKSTFDDGPDKPAHENNPREMQVLEQLEQTPSGVWYPTVVRRSSETGQKAGEGPEPMSTWFFLDFKADLPDRLFEPRDR
ncbi:MAG TPA: hypothetical protein VH120_03860, partial [Gemmataceae bacterium]|nr:hypothetical protein [Gemmataceae bacterium]